MTNKTLILFMESNVVFQQDDSKEVSIQNYFKTIVLQAMVLQPQTSNIWAADPQNIILFDASDVPKSFSQIIKLKKENLAGITINILFSEDKKRLIVVNKFVIHIYNIQEAKKITYVSEIPGDWETISAIINPSLNYIFFSEGYFKVLKIINTQDMQDPTKPIQYENHCQLDFYYSDFNELILNKYLIIRSTFNSLSGIVLTKFLASSDCLDLKAIPLFSFKIGTIKLIMTPDKKFILSILSFLAIQILEIKYEEDSISATLFQQIEMKTSVFQFSVKYDQQIILVSNEKSIDLYQRSTPNYNKLNPSLLNIPQNIVYDHFESKEQPWKCAYTSSTNILFQTRGNDGVYTFTEEKETKTLKQLYLFSYETFGYAEYVQPFNNDKNLVIGRDNYLYLYNIEDISNPIQLASTDFNNQNSSLDSGYITRDMKYIILSADTEGVIIADISDLSNPFQVAKIYHDYPESTPCSQLSVSQDENYVYASYRQQGLVIYDIQDKKTPKILSYLITLGGESTTLTSNLDIIILNDRQNGIQIVNVADKRNPKIISQTKLNGSLKSSLLLQNEKFMLCVMRNRGQLSLLDISNLSKPVVLQKYQYKDLIGGFDICADEKEKIGYLILRNQIVRITLYPDLIFNTDLFLLMQGKISTNQLIDKDQTLLVGMTVRIKLIQVYPNDITAITGAKFYYEYKIQQLPSWAFFSESDQSLTLQLNKNALITLNEQDESVEIDYTEQVVTQQFIFEIRERLLKDSFISQNLGVDGQMSEEIFTECINKNLLDDDFLVQQASQDLIQSLFKKKYSQKIIDLIIKVLKSNVTYYPVPLKIKSSLKAHFIENKKPFIESISDYIMIQVSIDRSQAQFMESFYQGLLVYFNDKGDTLKLEGDLSQINLMLEKGIKLANFTDPSQIIVTMVIDDNINFPLTEVFRADHKYLIYLNKPIVTNKEISLQEDFNKKFPSSSIYILEQFSYTISFDIFKDADSPNISYQAMIYQDGQFKEIPESFWLSFQSKERSFFGTTTAQMYLNEVKLMINATDGFTCAQDYFVIKINLVPIRIILITITQILGPIIGILGLWRYKSFVYNKIYHKYYQTTTIKQISGSEIQIQIPLLENTLKVAQNLWNKYYKHLEKQRIILEMNQLKSTNNHQNQATSNQQDLFQSQLSQSPPSPLQLQLKKESFFVLQVPEEKERRNISKNQQKMVKNLTSKIIDHEKKVRKSFQKGNRNHLNDKESQISFTFNYFLLSGKLNRSFILNDISQYYQKTTKNQEERIIEDLANPSSRLSKIVIGLAAISFSRLEKSTYQAVQYLKKIAQQDGYMHNDWYRYYVTIIPQFDKVFIDQFPLLKYDDDKLKQVLSVLYQSILNKDKNMKLLLPFIKEVISAIAFGFTLEKGRYVPAIRGECLETKSHQIQSIRAYRPLIKKKWLCSRNTSEMLVEKELSMNQIIPSWVQSIDISNEVILVKGKTENKDVGEHILKIFDKNNFILKQIRFIIFPEKQQYQNLHIDEINKENSSSCVGLLEDGTINDLPCDESASPNALQRSIFSSKFKSMHKLGKKLSFKPESFKLDVE